MRIVNRETFLKMPLGTVFQKYEPCIAGELCILTGKLRADFFCIPLTGLNFKESGTNEWASSLESANYEDVPVTLENRGRDGEFVQDQLFLVWSDDDCRRLIEILCHFKKIVL